MEEQTNENLNPNHFSKYVCNLTNPLIFCSCILSEELRMSNMCAHIDVYCCFRNAHGQLVESYDTV